MTGTSGPRTCRAEAIYVPLISRRPLGPDSPVAGRCHAGTHTQYRSRIADLAGGHLPTEAHRGLGANQRAHRARYRHAGIRKPVPRKNRGHLHVPGTRPATQASPCCTGILPPVQRDLLARAARPVMASIRQAVHHRIMNFLIRPLSGLVKRSFVIVRP